MKKVELVLVQTGKVDDRNWSASGYAIAVSVDGEYYSEQVLDEFDLSIDKDWYLVTPYVESEIMTIDYISISEELFNYLSE